MINIKAIQGDRFGFVGRIPEQFADGYFQDWTLKCQVRTGRDALVADLDAEWLDPLTTRAFSVTDTVGTELWPLGELFFDLRLESPTGSTKRTPIMRIHCERGVTRV